MKIFLLLILIIVCNSLLQLKYDSFVNYDDNDVELIARTKSEYQTIELVKDEHNDHCMLLNGIIQNHSDEYERTHDAIVNVSVKLSTKPVKNLLILGGGDGFPAMKSLEHENINITNVELDGTLINFVQTNPVMKKLTRNAFNHERVTIHADDAYEFIYDTDETYDIIIHDIELGTNQNVTKFSNHDFYIADKLLNEYGVLNYTDDLDDVPEFGPMVKYYNKLREKSTNKYVLMTLSSIEEFDYFNKVADMWDILKFKKKYPNAEIGLMNYFVSSSCGEYEFGDEIYIYISKNKFSRLDENIEFHKINLEYI